MTFVYGCSKIGFAGTYIVMSVVGYKITKKDVEQINATLQGQNKEGLI